MIIKPSTLKKGLPKNTQSLCPECKKVIPATIYDESGSAVMRKRCEQHGEFKDVIWSDVKKYLEAEKWAFDGIGLENPQIENAPSCPDYCGLCQLHTTHTALAIIDLTNRCNLSCPVCFANANSAGYVYEPSYEQVVKMLKLLRSERPVHCSAVQFSGGEPTLHPDYVKIVMKAKELGFSQIQIATNGIKLAKEPELAQKLRRAGLHTVYLQFDGVTDDVYVTTRGRPLLDIKKQAIKNCEKTSPRPITVVLVPTIVNGLNDNQCGDIVRFAIENLGAVRGVNFQPVSFSGRIEAGEREKQRFTLTDLLDRLEEQTDFLKRSDFYPVPSVAPISELLSTIKGEPHLAFTAHPHCGLATFCFVNKNGDVIPVPRFVDIEGMMREMMRLSEKASGTGAQFILRLMRGISALRSEKAQKKTLIKQFEKYFGRFIRKDKAPDGLDIPSLLSNVLVEGSKESVGRFVWKTLYIGGMHFQDLYNYDIERVRRCAIHYPTPDGRIIPFCAYNTGHEYRYEVEQKFAIPLEDYQKRNEILAD